MSTFLELAQALREKAGVSGTGPASVTGQSGELLRLVNWINDAYDAINLRHPHWDYLRKDVTFQTVAGQSTYAAAAASLTDFSEWKMDSFRAYRTTIGVADEQCLGECSWDAFRNRYLISTQRNMTGRPLDCAQKPDQSLILFPLPNEVFTITGEYYRIPPRMSADSDVPAFPAKFHRAIVWQALMLYAAYESAPELYAEGQREFERLMAKMEAVQLPQVLVAGAMA